MGSLFCENAGIPLREAWGDYVDTSEWLRDTPNFSGGLSPFGPLPTTTDDRKDGKFAPFYRTEWDIAQIRGECRAVAYLSSIAVGAVEALERYIIGKGFEVKAEPKPDVSINPALAKGLIDEVNRVIEEFMEQNAFSDGNSPLDCEIHSRLRHDGESLVELESRLMPNGRSRSESAIGVKARVIEPDNLTQPADTYALDRWLGLLDRVPTSWSFGVHTPKRDTDEVLGYYVVYGESDDEWAYVPAKVGHPANPLRTMVVGKRNVPRGCKRGLPDFMPIVSDLSREAKLSNNMAQGAALQAAIAWVEERPAHAPLPAGGAYTPQTSSAIGSAQFAIQGGGQKTINLNQFPAGSIPKVTNGFQFKTGPMGAERNNGFIEVAQYLLRRIGVRWNAPEYMISGDASNGNYASTLVAESPFVKARESDQRALVGIYKDTLWKVIQFYCMAGRFNRFVPTFQALKQIVKLAITPPEVATRDPLVLSQLLGIQQDKGWISKHTAQSKLGLDPESEEINGAIAIDETSGIESQPVVDPRIAAGGEMIGKNIQQVRRIDKLRQGYLDAFKAGTADEKTTRLALDGLGYSKEKIDLYLDADPANDPADEAEAVVESVKVKQQVEQLVRESFTNLMADPWKGYP